MVKQICTKAELNKEVSGNSGKLVVIDFYAEWCGPCRAIAPKVASMAEEFKDVVFLKVNVDVGEELSKAYCITCMPTFVFLKGGEKVDSFSGADEKKLLEMVKKHK
ncbi:putative thioredoxin [Opisthorchis viverrini]|uniref:Thioredoxin n=2 Tax=Opisthorchis viverrini TaxID=6198 RepID=A0A074ZG27_OPIVI|nr:hypothetical protein T265_07758 [Opisthorchis viverrini]KER24612.1 hypothetical protein T265_07758 [Opisthorchis viverrini]OON22909.1 putative thioredoxin [Opisthorchis viverrini]